MMPAHRISQQKARGSASGRGGASPRNGLNWDTLSFSFKGNGQARS